MFTTHRSAQPEVHCFIVFHMLIGSVILCVQGDYYESGTWLTEAEKLAINKKDEARRKLQQTKNRPTTTISLNMKAGLVPSK
jgi:hypothetical protein